MLTYNRQYIDKEDINSVLKALNSKFLTQGPLINKFENNLKTFFGAKYAVGTANGTCALHLAGIALNWKKGDIIIASPITFVATVNCAAYLKASVELVDIDKDTYNIDTKLLEKKIITLLKNGKKVHTVIITDYAGNPCDWKKLKILSKKFNFKLLNDNCHAIGASYQGSEKYACKFADIVTQSYHPVKNITTAEGGAILTNNKKYFKIIKSLVSHGILRDRKKYWIYDIKKLGYNYRLNEIQCALGLSQLKKLKKFIKKRREITNFYNQNFKNKLFFKTPTVIKNSISACHLYPLLINFNKLTISKDKFIQLLNKKNIFAQVHYKPIHKLSLYASIKGKFKVAENFYESEISLPSFFNLTKKQMNHVVLSIKKIVYKHQKA